MVISGIASQQENHEEKVEYLRQLKGFLREQPALGDGSDELNIRGALLSLEKQVTQYCRKHQITSPPPPESKVHQYTNICTNTCLCSDL